MTFDAPAVLVVGLLLLAVLVVAVVRTARRRPRPARAVAGTAVTLVGLVLLSVAAAGPVAAIPVPRSAGTVVLAIDVSNSMKATDVSPTRLAAAKKAARAFIAAQPASVDFLALYARKSTLAPRRVSCGWVRPYVSSRP